MSAAPRSPAVAPFVAALHITGGEPPTALEQLLPRRCPDLMLNLHADECRTHHGPAHGEVRGTIGAALAGPHTGPRVVDTRLQRRLVVGLHDLWGPDGATLRDRPRRCLRVWRPSS